MIEIPLRNIVKIDREKLYYRDEDGEIAEIKLQPCADNFDAAKKIINRPEGRPRCVGDRLFGSYSFYELYTSPEHTRLYMRLKTNKLKRLITRLIGWNFHLKEFEEFYYVQKRFVSSGWSTCDLS